MTAAEQQRMEQQLEAARRENDQVSARLSLYRAGFWVVTALLVVAAYCKWFYY